jgi:CTP:molybdopterin cytidylyltransferase MocA
VTVGGLLLAGGAGRRFGGPKQLALLHGRPLLEHAVRATTAVAALDPVVVVLGAAADEIRAAVDLGRARVVVAADWAEGQAASLRAGVAALGPVEAAVITLGDQPFLSAEVIGGVLAHREPAEWDAVRATYDGAPGHPVLLERALLARVGELRGDVGARRLLTGARVREWECGALADARDIDTRAALEAAQ